MAGQVASHLMAQAGMARAPWVITMIVSCLPVLVLGMGTALAHMLRADAAAAAEHRAGPAAIQRSRAWSAGDRDGPERGQPQTGRVRSARRQAIPVPGPRHDQTAAGADRLVQARLDQARVIARGCAAQGKQVSRRALRSGGIQGSNEALNALARVINAELTCAGAPDVLA